jgi:hypothetical protein
MRLFFCPPSVRAFSFLEAPTQLQHPLPSLSGATVELFSSIVSLLADLSTVLLNCLVIKSLIKPSKKSRKRK